MTNLDSGIVIIWTGTHAGIPEGYSRDTDFDGKYVLGCSSEDSSGGAIGGSATHSHESIAHSHSVSSSESEENTGYVKDRNNGARTLHSHNATDTSATVVTISYEDNDPAYYGVIFISSNGTKGVPLNAVTFFNEAPTQNGWYYCDGNNSTPALDLRYLKGATTGADAEMAGAGTHRHEALAHSHSDMTSGVYGDKPITDGESAEGVSGDRHTHNVRIPETTTQESSDGQINLNFSSLYAYQNQNQEELLVGTIAIWKGDKTSIPTNWEEYTSTRDVFVKVSSFLISGVSSAHTHTFANHTHEVVQLTNGDNAIQVEEGGSGASPREHSHQWSATAEAISIISSEPTPPYIKAFFIKYTAPDVVIDDYLYPSIDEDSLSISINEDASSYSIDEDSCPISLNEDSLSISIEEDNISTKVN